jgi:hypothetical protein
MARHIENTISTFDRVIFKGHLSGFFPRGAFGRYLWQRGVLLKDAGKFFESETKRIRKTVPCRRHRRGGSRQANSPHVPPYRQAARPRPHHQGQELTPLPRQSARIQSHGRRRALQKSGLPRSLPRSAGCPRLTGGLKLPRSCQVLGGNCITGSEKHPRRVEDQPVQCSFPA